MAPPRSLDEELEALLRDEDDHQSTSSNVPLQSGGRAAPIVALDANATRANRFDWVQDQALPSWPAARDNERSSNPWTLATTNNGAAPNATPPQQGAAQQPSIWVDLRDRDPVTTANGPAEQSGQNPDQYTQNQSARRHGHFASSQRAQRQEDRRRRAERTATVFGSREDVQRDDYTSPITDMFARAERYRRQLDQDRLHAEQLQREATQLSDYEPALASRLSGLYDYTNPHQTANAPTSVTQMYPSLHLSSSARPVHTPQTDVISATPNRSRRRRRSRASSLGHSRVAEGSRFNDHLADLQREPTLPTSRGGDVAEGASGVSVQQQQRGTPTYPGSGIGSARATALPQREFGNPVPSREVAGGPSGGSAQQQEQLTPVYRGGLNRDAAYARAAAILQHDFGDRAPRIPYAPPMAADDLAAMNRYLDNLHGRPFVNAAAGQTGSPLENRENVPVPTPTLDSPARPPSLEDEDMMVSIACQICYAQKASVVLLPCGHMIMCEWCADATVPPSAHGENGHYEYGRRRRYPCPKCRRMVSQRHKVHL